VLLYIGPHDSLLDIHRAHGKYDHGQARGACNYELIYEFKFQHLQEEQLDELVKQLQ
jgi:hypothetical protein